MFLWNLTGRQRWTDAGPQVWRFLKKLSDIWKGGRKTSLWFCSQVKFVAARTAVGFFSKLNLLHLFCREGVSLPWFSLVSSIFILRPSFYRFMSVFLQMHDCCIQFSCHLWQVQYVHIKNPIIARANYTRGPGILISAPTGGRCS